MKLTISPTKQTKRFRKLQNTNTRSYLQGQVILDNAKVEMLKNSNYSDRKFLNEILSMVYSKKELKESSAKGFKSHGKCHKALNAKRLLFVERKLFVVSILVSL